MSVEVKKLDGRHNGHTRFTHMVEIGAFNGTDGIAFLRAREYCWQTFGPSCELEWAKPAYFNDVQPKWAFTKNDNWCRIYLTEEVLTQFLLVKDRWGI
jgi:hypothetical protein